MELINIIFVNLNRRMELKNIIFVNSDKNSTKE
jgi:hypothetical protein